MKNGTTKVVVTIAAIVLALGFYFVLLGQRGLDLIREGESRRSGWESACCCCRCWESGSWW
ncbi:hypothetical protein BTZ20_2417 [Rhodococcus sp. MTM3W5.2]|nr:hypothetical protein BTZ20_2417 [Rhodococcus sp. MTM3W5.2]